MTRFMKYLCGRMQALGYTAFSITLCGHIGHYLNVEEEILLENGHRPAFWVVREELGIGWGGGNRRDGQIRGPGVRCTQLTKIGNRWRGDVLAQKIGCIRSLERKCSEAEKELAETKQKLSALRDRQRGVLTIWSVDEIM